MIAVMGAIGGLANCTHSKEFHLPHADKKARTWRPGWVGNVLLGSVAAVVVWGIYGPFALYDFFDPKPVEFHLTLTQLASSLLTGISGSRILTLESQKAIIEHQRDDEMVARRGLNETLKAARKKLRTYERASKSGSGKPA